MIEPSRIEESRRLEITAESDISKRAVRTTQYKALNDALSKHNKPREEPSRRCTTCGFVYIV